MRAVSPKKLAHSIKNRMYTMLKNYELKNLWWRFSLYLALTFLVGAVFAIVKRLDDAREVFASITHTLINFKKIWSKRMRTA